MRLLGPASIAAILLGLVGCGQQGVSSSTVTQRDAEPIRIASDNSAASALLSRIVAGVPTDAGVVSVTYDSKDSDPETPGQGWLHIVVQKADEEIRPTWEGYMIAAAYGDEAKEAGAPSHVGYRFYDTSGDGAPGYVGSEVYDGQDVDPSDHQDTSTVSDELKKSAEDLGLADVSVSFDKPDGFAPVVTATAKDVKSFLNKAPYIVNGLISPDERSGFDGLFVRVLDTDGRVVTDQGYSTRLEVTVAWHSPDAEKLVGGCFGLDCTVPPPSPN